MTNLRFLFKRFCWRLEKDRSSSNTCDRAEAKREEQEVEEEAVGRRQ